MSKQIKLVRHISIDDLSGVSINGDVVVRGEDGSKFSLDADLIYSLLDLASGGCDWVFKASKRGDRYFLEVDESRMEG